ncbi:hypothetical protein FT641_27195 [Bacillus paranthracis]|uniref:hypothetical protein n=1 Tax=Bacillus paranthracis TaxID=2026186 RepID=UPI000BFDFF4C|nr:hypothetical protein [Bacillus paranthracis]MBE7117261.1 hypothetical protein [Bacillus paranthracis]MBE7134875.1 hypothetical protein [Bacillus paranthracis]MBE7156363.1 hypothetical protein [Bacillus paranthracis]PGZ29495.1 hypothetical protein COE50_22030 [Bacillus anthracis]
MATFEEVQSFIDENILHSDVFDAADVNKKRKAVKNAENVLRNFYGSSRQLPVEAIANQTIWLLQIDDSIRRAEQGVTNVNVMGISISMAQIDRSISPQVIKLLGRRIGRYGLEVQDTYRHRSNPKYGQRL